MGSHPSSARLRSLPMWPTDDKPSGIRADLKTAVEAQGRMIFVLGLPHTVSLVAVRSRNTAQILSLTLPYCFTVKIILDPYQIIPALREILINEYREDDLVAAAKRVLASRPRDQPTPTLQVAFTK